LTAQHQNHALKAAVIQHQSPGYDKHKNLQTSAKYIEQAAQAGAQLIVLQELHTTAYFCYTQKQDYFDLAEPLNGTSVKYLKQIAADLNITLVGSIFERRTAGIYHNTAVVLDGDAGMVGFYRKMHIPDDPGFNEKYYFTPGDATLNGRCAFQPIQTRVGRLGLLVCWDQWYPEAARLAALQGAEMLIYPTAIGWDPVDTVETQQHQSEAWRIIQRSHAIANHLPVLVPNRVGEENGTQFWGQSFICGAQGEILNQANQDDEGIILADIDLQQTEQLRRTWPYFRDRRIDAYRNLTSRHIDQLN